MSAVCVPISLAESYGTTMTYNGKTYSSMMHSCTIIDMSNFLKYKEFAIQHQIQIVTDGLTLSVIDDAVMNIVEDQFGNILHLNSKLAANYNYTTVYNPALARYTGMASKQMMDQFKAEDKGENSYPRVNISIAKNPSTPTYTLKNELHIRTRQLGMTVSDGTARSYGMRPMFYFDTELNDSTQSKIKQFIATAQSQVTYLALIIIVIICALVMCLSYK